MAKDLKHNVATSHGLSHQGMQIPVIENFAFTKKFHLPLRHKTYSKYQGIRFGINGTISDFVGREEELKTLLNIFNERKFGNRVVHVGGIQGIGKTQFVKQFLQQSELKEANISWLQGENSNVLNNSIGKLAESLNIKIDSNFNQPENNETLGLYSKLIEKIAVELNNENSFPPWIIVIDNVDVNYEEFTNVSRQLNSNFGTFLIITSTVKNILDAEPQSLEIKSWENENVKHFMEKVLNPYQLSKLELNKISETFQNHPFAIRIATSFIKEKRKIRGTGYFVANYVKEFEKNMKATLNKTQNLGLYQKTLFTLLDTSLEIIKSENKETGEIALQLFNILSFVNPDGIEEDFLSKLYTWIDSDVEFSHIGERKIKKTGELSDLTESLELLSTYSLINYNQPTISLH